MRTRIIICARDTCMRTPYLYAHAILVCARHNIREIPPSGYVSPSIDFTSHRRHTQVFHLTNVEIRAKLPGVFMSSETKSDTETWVHAAAHLRDELGAWIADSVRRQRVIPYHGIHDEGSFTTSWDAYWFLTRDRAAHGFMTWLRDGFAAWANANFVHGYYPEGEVHHGTEPFTHFIARFHTLDPTGTVAPRLLDDAAEHTGNWVDGVPDWYDWERHRIVSWYIGSCRVPTDPPNDYEEPDSIRPAMMALSAYVATGRRRYLDFCLDYGNTWADALLEEPLPRVGFFHTDDPAVYPARLFEERDLEQRVELIVASGMIDFLLDLYLLTGTDRYVTAVERLVPTLVETVADPRNATSAAHLARYRRITDDRSHDAAIIQALPDLPAYDAAGFSLLERQDEKEQREIGLIFNKYIGHRFDQVRWGRPEGDSIREVTEPTPAAWALAFHITGDERYAARAMFIAGERVRVGRNALDDGREHGCGGYSVGALASGHGRADRFGDVNSVFGPLMLGSIRLFNAEHPLVEYPDGLPKQIATLVSWEPEPRVRWHNSGDTSVSFSWRDASKRKNTERKETLAPGETKSAALGGSIPDYAIGSME